MGLFKRFAYGLCLGVAGLVLLFIGNSEFPGTLGQLAFSPIALFALFSMMTLEAVYSFR